MTATTPPHAPYKQLRRPTTDRMVAGVASGVGRYFAVDPTLVRVIFAVAGLLTGGVALIAYPIMWFLMPEEPAGAPAWPHPTGAAPQGPPPAAGSTPQPTQPTYAPTTTYPTAGPTPPTAA
ncbi:PspC domain-containing protein [Micromonospora krabiensis]|uniref:Phage shock protein C (PspC) family protein n=1 Tax=Micromonospora krabiensis TaxID=307121 RepID=A0A1C3NAR3_9ACTN|nr:PspC domain-containing protein [Micromonospora krabiensis]SBV29660.1 phage shock protein C (PspC) family protein [Micromonospora krabiensis]